VDIGRSPRWRATIDRGQLTVLEHIESEKVTESVVRGADGSVRYMNPGARRMLRITITRQELVPGFDAAIWRP
jgi:hypothetical protein